MIINFLRWKTIKDSQKFTKHWTVILYIKYLNVNKCYFLMFICILYKNKATDRSFELIFVFYSPKNIRDDGQLTTKKIWFDSAIFWIKHYVKKVLCAISQKLALRFWNGCHFRIQHPRKPPKRCISSKILFIS